MQKLSSNQIRQLWLDFFQKHNHLVLPSQSLVPHNDPSLLLINSGVATLKDYFANKKTPPAPNLVNSQKCIRTNDIEKVGTTARHLTFFEMLGNFSIGGYFKEQAIGLAYDFLFNVLQFAKSKIYITYHHNDKVTYETWLALGINADHLIKGNDTTNFWDVGRGPCGYDTEIFYDRGETFDPHKQGLELLKNDVDNDRYLEIWNIVFSEFNNDGHNNYQELKLKNIDTGAGLERIVSIFQNGATNFDTDLFLPIIDQVAMLTDYRYDAHNYFQQDKNLQQKEINKYFKIISDHLRAITMAIQDGVKPSNTTRGYVIRKLIRRAYRSGIKLNISHNTFLHTLVEVVAKTLAIYPVDVAKVASIIEHEELIFAKTIKQGEELLRKVISETKAIDSQIAWKLFETYGYPLDLTIEIAHEHNIPIDISDFNRLQDEHAQISKNKKHQGMDLQNQVIQTIDHKVSEFIGYERLEVTAPLLFQGMENDKNYSVFAQTPFYATSGGQLCDRGTIDNENVLEVFKDQYGNHWHVTQKSINHQTPHLVVDEKNRFQAMCNHSATHLLGRAIYDILGYTTQLGSDNNAKKLRLDFPAEKRPSDETIQKIEDRVNYYIKSGLEREYLVTTKREAINMGAWVLEKESQASTFDDEVRVVNFGNISIELCGGTHVANSRDCEAFKIIKVESKGSGTYRIDAITTWATIDEYEASQINHYQKILENLIRKNQAIDQTYHLTIPATLSDIKVAIASVKNDYKKLLKNQQNNMLNLDDLTITFIDYENMPTYINLQLSSINEARALAIKLREKYPRNLIIVGVPSGVKQTIIVASQTYDSNNILQKIMQNHEGRGGGQKMFAMGQTKTFDKL